ARRSTSPPPLASTHRACIVLAGPALVALVALTAHARSAQDARREART
ncbi:hypothetical protein EE612_049765, partial [Oryza sativa]